MEILALLALAYWATRGTRRLTAPVIPIVTPKPGAYALTPVVTAPVAPVTGSEPVKQAAKVYRVFWAKEYGKFAGRKLSPAEQDKLAGLLSKAVYKPFSFADWNEIQAQFIAIKSAFNLGAWQIEVAPLVNGEPLTYGAQDGTKAHPNVTITKAPTNGLVLNLEPRHVEFTPPPSRPWNGQFIAYLAKTEWESHSPGVWGTIANLYDAAHDLSVNINWTAVLVSLAAVGVVVVTGGVAAPGLVAIAGETGALVAEATAAAAVVESGRKQLDKYVTVK